jgi:imidazole glycerol-phosphate synthase subunit HisF
MLRPRIIPCLLVHDGGLVKTVGFGDAKYVGDPINAVRIFNEKEVDELIVVDIDATVEGREPDYGMIEDLAAECRMPLCYGGGVKSAAQIERIVGLGVEKVAVSSGLVDRPECIAEAAASVGGQSVVAVLDVRRHRDGSYEVFTHNGTRPTGQDPADLAARMQQLGAGEIVVNSIDHDGQMKGYDLELVGAVRSRVTIPMTCLGGAGSLKDLQDLIAEHGTIGAAAGSLFVFKGVYRAVLINYPSPPAKEAVFRDARQAGVKR